MEELTAELKDSLQISEFPRSTIVDESNKVDDDDNDDDQDIQKQPSWQESFLPDSTVCITVPENKIDTSHHPIDRNDLILPDWDPTEDDWILSILAVDESEQELSSHDISIDESPLTYSLLPVVSLPTIGSDTWDTSSWEANSIQNDEPWNFSLDENPNDIFLDINDYENIFDSSELDTDYPQQHINNNNNILETLEYSLSRLTMIESSNSMEAHSSQYTKDNKDFEEKEEEEEQSSPKVLVPDSDLLLPWPEDYNQYNALPLEDLANFFTGTEYDKNSLDQQDSPFEQSSQPYQADQEPPDENLMNEFYGTDYDYYTAKELPSALPAFMCCQPCQPGQEEIVNRGNPDQNWNPFLSDTALFCHPSFPDMEVHGSSPFVKNYTNNKDEEKELSSSSPQGPQSNAVAGRRRAIQSALPYTVSFASGIHQPISEGKQQRPNERVCLGHKEVIFGLEFSPCGNYMATASQDSTIRIWDVHQHRLLQALTAHDAAYECLRVAWASKTWGDEILDREGKHKYILATGGADGVVKLWSAERPEGHWTCHDTLDHSSFENKGQPTTENKADPPQIYSLQFINHWKGIADGTYQNNAFLLTSSDDFVHLWEVAEEVKEGELPVMGRCKLLEVMSMHFTCLEDFGFGVAVTNVTNTGLQLTNSETLGGKKRKLTPGQIPNHTNSFGGARNPQHIIYVFDAQYCPANGLLGVALSDGSLRIMNGRGVCVTPVTLPGKQSHLTSFCWDAKGQRMATCVATGHLILWDILISQGQTSVRPGCRAILEGGHIPSRPLYGAKYCGDNRAIIEQSSSLSSAQKNSEQDLEDDSEDLILSWGVDGRLCLWDSKSEGNVTAPLSTLVSDPQYSLYTVDVAYEAIVDSSKIGVVAESHQEGKEDMNSKNEIVPNGKRIATIGCGGGGQGDAGFLGVPVYLYDVKTP